MWRIDSIRLHWPVSRDILPEAEFTLYQQKQKKIVSGWLPVHHGHIEYDLEFNNQSKIVRINNIRTVPKQRQHGYKTIQKAAHQFFRSKKSDNQMRKERTQLNKETYLRVAKQALTDMALWTAAVVYSYYRIRTSDFRKHFVLLTKSIENICKRGSEASIPRLLYNQELAAQYINRTLAQMGELPYEDWKGFQERMAWQSHMRYHTASLKHPGEHVSSVEKYKNLWTTSEEINTAAILKKQLRPNNVRLVIGSPCPSIFDSEAVAVVRSLEDAYRLKCFVVPSKICIINEHNFSPARLRELGVSDISILTTSERVYVAYAHYWSVSDWIQLINKKPLHYTCCGRLDQYPSGRGQIFRDMCDSEKFGIEYAHHRGAENIIIIPPQEDVTAFTNSVRETWKVVQCFGFERGVDTGRREFKRPFRIRTLRHDDSKRLYEEKIAKSPGKNVSMMNIFNYRGLHVPAVVIFCNKNTTPFDIHVARTWATDVLYIVEQRCKMPCMFSFKRTTPKKITINPFT